jgi:hypothetical protein
MKKGFLSFSVGFFLFIIALNSSGAPIPPVCPVNICGTVSEAKWMPEEMVKGIPGMSGSAGHDRVVPAHFLIALRNFDGVDSETTRRITGYLAGSAFEAAGPEGTPPLMLLKINHPDKNYLRKGMNIDISGYTVRGDEGGTWTSYERIDVVSSGSIPCNAHSDVIRLFFNLINDHRIAEALGMMDPLVVSSDSNRCQWAEQFEAIASIGISRIEPLAVGGWSDREERYKIVLKVQVKPEAANETIPYYGWEEGENIRWVNIQADDQGFWRIKGIGTGP